MRWGAQLELTGNITIANVINMNGGTNGQGNAAGINGTGALLSVSGNNTITSQLTFVGQDSGLGVAAGSTLNLAGGIVTTGHVLYLTGVNGGGALNFTNQSVGAFFGLVNMGGLNTTLQVALGGITNNNLNIYSGSLTLSGGGRLSTGAADAVLAYQGASLNVNDSIGLPIVNRLAGNALTLTGATFNYTGSSLGNSSETIAALTIQGGSSVITISAGANLAATITAPSIAESGGGQLLITGNNLGGAGGVNVASFVTNAGPTYIGAAGLTGTVNKGILPWAVVGNTNTPGVLSFATQDSVNGTAGAAGAIWRPLASSEYVTSMANGYAVTVNNLVFGNSQTLVGSVTDNSLNLANGGGLIVAPMQILTLSSGGFLAQTGNTGVTGVNSNLAGGAAGFLSAGGTALFAYTTAPTTLSSVVLGTAGLDKAGSGQLTISNFEPYTGTTTVNQGTLQLAAGTGVTNPIIVGVNTTGNALVVNNGGTVDLDGNVQLVSTLNSTSATVNTGIGGGIITSSTGNGTLVTTTGATTSAISLQGANVNFIRSGTSGNYTLVAPQTYGGTTVINGGGFTNGSTLLGLSLTDAVPWPARISHSTSRR